MFNGGLTAAALAFMNMSVFFKGNLFNGKGIS